MKTFTEMFAKSQLASTSHPNGICVCHIVNSKSTKYARKKGFEFLKSFVLHDMTWQSVYHPLKPCVRIDFYAWMQTLSHSTTTLIYALMIHIGHWAVGARKCTFSNMTKLSLCVMHVWRSEKAAAHQKNTTSQRQIYLRLLFNLPWSVCCRCSPFRNCMEIFLERQ